MSDSVDRKQNSEKDKRSLPFALRLRSPASTRQSLARLIREYARGNIDPVLFKSLVWALSQLLNAFKVEKDLEIEARLQAIEDAIGRRQ